MVKQNIEFTLKKTDFYIVRNISSHSEHKLKILQIPAQQSLDNHAANGCYEPIVLKNSCLIEWSIADSICVLDRGICDVGTKAAGAGSTVL